MRALFVHTLNVCPVNCLLYLMLSTWCSHWNPEANRLSRNRTSQSNPSTNFTQSNPSTQRRLLESRAKTRNCAALLGRLLSSRTFIMREHVLEAPGDARWRRPHDDPGEKSRPRQSEIPSDAVKLLFPFANLPCLRPPLSFGKRACCSYKNPSIVHQYIPAHGHTPRVGRSFILLVRHTCKGGQ